MRHFGFGQLFASTLEEPLSGGFSIYRDQFDTKKPPFRAAFLLLLYFLEDFVLARRLIKLLQLNLALNLFLVFARKEDVPRRALDLYKVVL